MLRFVRLTPNAKTPSRATPYSAGLDIYAAEHYILPPGKSQLCSTGITLAIPNGYSGQLAARSGLATKYSIQIGAGIIDSDYRGEIKILLFNHGQENFEIHIGDSIGQLIIHRILLPDLIECNSLDITLRGHKGFGSSDIAH